MSTETQTAYNGHKADCLCPKCMDADFNHHVEHVLGLDPKRYSDKPGMELPSATGSRRGNAVAGLVNAGFARADRMITDPQRGKIRFLAGERDLAQATQKVQDAIEDLDSLDRRAASDLIEKLLDLPHKPKQATTPARFVGEGFYLFNNSVFRVRISNSSGRPYALRLDPDTGRFDYDRGTIFKLKTSMRLTLEQAAKLGAKWHRCCVCGAELTHPDSIESGIGPVCAERL